MKYSIENVPDEKIEACLNFLADSIKEKITSKAPKSMMAMVCIYEPRTLQEWPGSYPDASIVIGNEEFLRKDDLRELGEAIADSPVEPAAIFAIIHGEATVETQTYDDPQYYGDVIAILGMTMDERKFHLMIKLAKAEDGSLSVVEEYDNSLTAEWESEFVEWIYEGYNAAVDGGEISKKLRNGFKDISLHGMGNVFN